MVAQAVDEVQQTGVDFGQGTETVGPQPQAEPEPNEPRDKELERAVDANEERNDQSSDGSGNEDDVTEFIFKTLTHFGYPPRRLEQYEEEFVKEKIFPDGSREVTLVIPDRYYGSKKRLSNKDFTNIVNSIQKQFGLNFEDAERSDLKVTLNFNSRTMQEQENESQAGMINDVLTQVYGPGKDDGGLKNKKPKRNKAACTIQEMIKESKNSLFDKLI